MNLKLVLVQVIELDVRQVNVLLLRQLSVLAIPGLNLGDLGHGSAFDGGSAAFAIGQVSEELVDAIGAKGSGQGGVLHLLVAEHGHGRVAKATNVHSLLQVKLSSAFGPDPAPALLLELVSHLCQHVQVLVPALALAVQDMGQERDDTEGLLFTILLHHLLAGDLDQLWRINVLHIPIQGPVDNVLGGSAAIVLFRAGLGAGWEVLNGRIPLNSVLRSQTLVNSGIDSSQLDLALQFRGSSLPMRLQVLAVTTPRSKELDQPHVVRLQDQLLKVGLCQLDYVVRSRASTASAATATRLASKSLSDNPLGNFLSLVNDALSISSAIVVLRLLFVGSENLDGGESLDSKLTAKGLVLIAIYSANVDDARQGLGSLLVLWGLEMENV